MAAYQQLPALVAILIVAAAALKAGAQGAPATQPFKSPDANAAVADYQDAVGAAKAELIRNLSAAMDKATRAGDLDEAIAVRDLIRSLQLPVPAQAPAAAAPSTAPSTTPIAMIPAAVLGTWDLIVTGNADWHARLIVNADGSFVENPDGARIKGMWKIDGQALVLAWPSGTLRIFTISDGMLVAPINAHSAMHARRPAPGRP
jgi:hypothetical protein